MQLEDRFYSSTEVADILGVSLRSIYRYLEEDKLTADVKTATGRHRFTKQNIMDFLYPDGAPSKSASKSLEASKQQPQQSTKVEEQEDVQVEEDSSQEAEQPAEETQEQQEPQPTPQPQEAQEEKEQEQKEEEVDWLQKFREAAEKYKKESESAQPASAQPQTESTIQKEEPKEEPKEETPPAPKEEVKPKSRAGIHYYRSGVGGLKDIAQKLDSVGRSKDLSYAFTMHAGMSLHKPINPFSLLHSYVSVANLEQYESELELSEAKLDNAQLCLIATEEGSVFANRKEMHGLYVVADDQLKKDLQQAGETELANQVG